MRDSTIALVLIGLSLSGCIVGLPEKMAQPDPAEGTVRQSSEAQKAAEPTVPIAVETPEIVRLLEEADIVLTATTHSQYIIIRTRDGREYTGEYVHGQNVKYPDTACGDILNLVDRIKSKRPPEEVKDWAVICE